MKLFTKPTTALFALCATSSLLISGCSSSDKSPSSNAISNPNNTSSGMQVSQTEISGNVIKGTIKNADVHFYSIGNDQINASPFASTKTDESGSFSIRVPSGSISEALYVEVLAAADGSSTMTCDAEVCGSTEDTEGDDANGNGQFDFGETIKLTDDFRLSTAVTNFKNSDHIKLSVTPMSHLAMQNAKRKGKLDSASIILEMRELAKHLNLPAELSQLVAQDITNLVGGELDEGSILYSLYSSAIASYAHKNRISVASAIDKIDAELYDANGNVNHELLLDLLHFAHKNAGKIAKGKESLHKLLSQVMLVISHHECLLKGGDCGQGPDPDKPADTELAKVKGFVGDFRSWVRELTMQNNPALANFKARSKMVGGLWEDDVKVLASALNDVLPGIAQAVSPAYDFCYYCEVGGLAFAAASVEKELVIGDLQYLLGSDGSLNIQGMIRDVDVDIQLQLPTPEQWATDHSVEILAGRLSRNNMDLVISKGSSINATFPEGVRFDEIISGIQNDVAPVASELTAAVTFFIEAEYGISPGGIIDFETAVAVDWLDTGDWSVTDTKSRGGAASLRSAVIGNNATSQASATINTWGGYLSFNYSVESEAGYDFFNVYVDGDKVLSASGFQPEFKSAQIFLAPGEHTVVWEYAKDASVGFGKDAVWIDDIQYPVLAGDSSQEVVSHNILNGTMSVTAYKLDEPWQYLTQSYLPGDVRVNAVFSNQFLATDSIQEDKISLNIAATITNAAEFEPPQPDYEGTLERLGNYTVTDSQFTFNMPNWSIRITALGDQRYTYEVYQAGEDDPYLSRVATSTRTTMKDVAGELIDNSGIGMSIVVPQKGLYLTTLLQSSPWGIYPNSRFNAAGGDIYGYLVDPYDPTETEDQFLKIAASFEMNLKPYALPELTFGSSLTRDTLNEGSFEFYLIVNGKRFNFDTQYWYNLVSYDSDEASVDLNNPRLTITNHDGVQLALAFPDVENAGGDKLEPLLEGDLVYNNVVYGTITRVKGITAVEYVDGTGESIP
jgi:hypothetical protein